MPETGQRTIRVAVLGAAAFAEQAHIPAINAHPQAEVVALYSRDLARATDIAARTSVPETSDDLHSLLARRDIDAVTVVSSNDRHHPYTIAALQAGKHVFCEKPMALDAGQAAEMTREARRRGVVHQIAFTFRHTFCLDELRRRVASGGIGEPHYVEIHSEWSSGLQGGARSATWRDDASLHGAGHLGEMGSHFIDAINFVCGPARGCISQVAALTHTVPRLIEGPNGPQEAQTVDLAAFLVRTEQGLAGHVFASRVTPPPVAYGVIHSGAPQRGHMGYIIVTGETGALMATFTRGEAESLREARPGQPWEAVSLPPGASDGQPHGVTRMLASFVDAVLHGHSDPERDATFEDGYRSQAAMDAIIKASASRRWEPVPTALD